MPEGGLDFYIFLSFTLTCLLTHIDNLSGSFIVALLVGLIFPSGEVCHVKGSFINEDIVTAPEQVLGDCAVQCDH